MINIKKILTKNSILLILFSLTLIIYINYDIKIFKNLKETFQNMNDNENENENDNNDTNNDNDNYDNDNNELSQSNNYVMNTRKESLLHFLDSIKKIEIPIIIDDNGVVCNDWSNDNKNRFPNKGNKCQLIKSKAYCINNNNKITTCNKLYDKKIQEIATIDIDNLIAPYYNELFMQFSKLDKDIKTKENELNDIINRLITKKNLNLQQEFFIKQNSNFINESQNLENDINNDYDEKTNDYNMFKTIFNNTQDEITIINNYNDMLRKIIIFISVILVLILVFYILTFRI